MFWHVGVKAPGTETMTSFFSLASARGGLVYILWVLDKGIIGYTFAGVVLDGDAAGCYAGEFWGVGDVGESDAFGEVVSGLEGSHCC